MLRHSFLTITLALISCGPAGPRAKEQLLAHNWALTPDACSTDYLRFTPTAFEVHHAGTPTTALQVLDMIVPSNYPDNVMVVVGPNPPGSATEVAEEDKVAFLLEIVNGHMKLIGGGSPSHPTASTADNPNVQRFALIACS